MRSRLSGLRTLMVVIGLTAILPTFTTGQAADPAPRSSTPARTPDGQPDIQGFWGGGTLTIEPGYDGNLGTGYYQDFFPTGANIAQETARAATPKPATPKPAEGSRSAPQARARIRTDSPDGRIPFLPWARDRKESNFKTIYKPDGPDTLDEIDTVARCLPAGVPRASYISIGAYQILQPPGYVVFLGEWNHLYRIIPLDKRPHLGSAIRMWTGDSRGHWEGNTLVIETTNSNGRTWLDHMGSIHTDSLKVTERYTIGTPDRIDYEITMDDPKAFSRPWKLLGALDKNQEPGFELLEYACHEGNARSMESYTSKK